MRVRELMLTTVLEPVGEGGEGVWLESVGSLLNLLIPLLLFNIYCIYIDDKIC